MSWSGFLEPQLILGLGAFAAGVINAYVQQRFFRGDGEIVEAIGAESLQENAVGPAGTLEEAVEDASGRYSN